MFIAVLFTIDKIWKQLKCPQIDEWIKKIDYYLAIKKNVILPFVTAWVDREGIMLSEVSQTEKEKYCMVSLIPGI